MAQLARGLALTAGENLERRDRTIAVGVSIGPGRKHFAQLRNDVIRTTA
jgi:hypothetical protein